MLLKACARWGKFVPYPNTWCPACKPLAEKEREEQLSVRKKKRDADYNRKRDPKYTRFYSSTEWKRLSKAKLQDAGWLCEECGAVATEVHHVAPIQTEEGWERRLDWTNLKALCLRCHNAAHGRFKGSRRRHGVQTK